MFLSLNFNKVYAADAKLVSIPRNPRVGDTFTLRVNITGTDCYSISFVNLNESSNIEYVSMDSEKKAKGTTPLTGYIQAKYKVLSYGTTEISAEIKIKSAPLVDKKLDLDNITEKVVTKKLTIVLVPEVKNVTKITGKYEVTDNEVNIRPHPSTKYSSLGIYNKGKVIDVIGKTGDWYQFKYNSKDAYMHKDYLKEIVEEIEEVVSEDNTLTETEEVEEVEQEAILEEPEEIVKDPKEAKDNTIILVILALIVAIAIIIAIIYLIRQGRDYEYDDDDDDYDYEDDEK